MQGQHRTFHVGQNDKYGQLKSANQLDSDSIFNSFNHKNDLQKIHNSFQYNSTRQNTQSKRAEEPRDSYNDALFSNFQSHHVQKNKDFISNDIKNQFKKQVPHHNSRQNVINNMIDGIYSLGSSPRRSLDNKVDSISRVSKTPGS